MKEEDYIRQSTKISFLLCENVPTSIYLNHYGFLWLAVCQKKCHGVFGFSESRGAVKPLCTMGKKKNPQKFGGSEA